MRLIPLTQGLFAKVDDEDFERLSKYSWRILRNRRAIYAMTTIRNNGVCKEIYMHRLILGITDTNIHIDHKDLDGLNNQKHNLRPCTRSQNLSNSESHKNTSSKYKGVSKFRNKWAADVRFSWKTIHLGIYNSEIDAAMAADKKSIELHGEFARTNFSFNVSVQRNKLHSKSIAKNVE